ncbi:MAG: acyl-CoA thioesterase [Nitrososphaerales archaeon]
MDSSQPKRESRLVSESALVTTHLMMPPDANIQGNVYGGTIMKMMDEIAGAVAALHARKNVVTASIDRMSFYAPVYIGNLLLLKAAVNYVGRTSMEVGVRIEAKSLQTAEVVHTGSSYLTFVALDESGNPTEIAEIVPETEDEKRRYAEASARRAQRLNEAKVALQKEGRS